MRSSIFAEGVNYDVRFNSETDYNLLYKENSFIIYLYRYSYHSYSYRLFFYNSLFMSVGCSYRTKRELLDVVQNLVDLYLYSKESK